jgi:peptidyl-prolyl cis-trans isomerase A (cyclophilin A)
MLNRFAAAVALACSTPAAAQDAPTPPRTDLVVLETALGVITLEIESGRAPITAANFLRYVDEHRLDGTVFYRAMRLAWGEQPNGLVQAGTQYDPKRVLPPIAHEPTTQTGLSHSAGAISMARYAPGTATGDFSIMVSDQLALDADPKGETDDARAGFAVFGHVVSGMDVVRKIFAAPTDPEKGEGWMKGQMLATPVPIVHARRLGGKP